MIGFDAGGIANFARYMGSTDKSIWVAESQDDVVGYVTTTIYKTSKFAVVPAEEPYVEIDDLYVSPECRSQSLGRADRSRTRFCTSTRNSLRHGFYIVVQGGGHNAIL